MLYFLIPLRSRHSACNWEEVCRRYRATLRSLQAQTSERFRVLVAGHEHPELEPDQPAPVFLKAYFDPPPPDDWVAQRLDRDRKLHMLLVEAGRLGGGAIMRVDADDLISRNLVAYVEHHPFAHGFFLRYGYEYRVSSGRLHRNPFMHRYCGSTHIVRVMPQECPRDMSDADSPTAPLQYLLRHPRVSARAKEIGRPLQAVPFPACIFVTDYGDNLSFREARALGQKMPRRGLIVSWLPSFEPTAEIRQEFGLV